MIKKNNLNYLILLAFLITPLLTSIISTIHVINFFELSNNNLLALILAISFEFGALAALAGLLALDKINKNVVVFIFVLLTLYQMMGNTFAAYDYISIKMQTNPNLIKNWTELFGLMEEDGVLVKRIIAIISGAILPVVSLSFLDLSVDYIQKSSRIVTENKEINSSVKEELANDATVENSETSAEQKQPISEEQPEIELEEIITEENSEENQHAEFKQFMQDKKQKVDQMREPNLELLKVFYDDGRVKINEELPSYSEFLSKINTDIHPPRDVNFFLTLCNYLEISKLSGTQKIALKSYEEAYQIINNYFTISNPDNI